MNFQKLKEVFLAVLDDLLVGLKPERIQGLTIPAETPMTHERIRNRAVENGFELLLAPVAIRKVYQHRDFAEAMAAACSTVAKVAADFGHAPKVVIDGGSLTITLGIEIPNLLSEADFDVADALKDAFDDSGSHGGAGDEPSPGTD